MTHKSIINKWPTLTDFANDIGVQYGTAKAMRRRGRIPSGRWARVVAAANDRGISGVTFEKLAKMVATAEPTPCKQESA